MPAFKTVQDVEVKGKKVLLRVDFNVPLGPDGVILDNSRIRAALPTINYLLGHGARVIMLTHLGRPKNLDDKFRVDVIAEALEQELGTPVLKADKTVGPEARAIVDELDGTKVALLENVRFNEGEARNDPQFARSLADLADIYVNDAFGVCHRKHASVFGVAELLPAYAGLLLEKEVLTLGNLLKDPDRPLTAILGGSKVSDKILVIERFLDLVDVILTGGGMFCTFLKAKGYETGKSLMEPDKVEDCRLIMAKAEKSAAKLYLPEDVVIARDVTDDAEVRIVPVHDIPADWRVLDIGPKTIARYVELVERSKTIFWNGPMGVYEREPFKEGTFKLAQAITSSRATTVIGGGDTDAALRRFSLEDKVTFVSTGGGASLKFLEGAPMPGIEALKTAAGIKA